MTQLNQEALIEAYREAIYCIETADGSIYFRIDQQNPELDRLLNYHNAKEAVFITAFNPKSKLLSDHENLRANEKLCSRITQAGFQWISGWSGSQAGDWPKEASYLVLSMTRKTGKQLGLDYRQTAIVWIRKGSTPRLFFCDDYPDNNSDNPIKS